MADWPEEGRSDRPPVRPRVPSRSAPDVPDGEERPVDDAVPAEVLDPDRVVLVVAFGRVVVVVEELVAADDDRRRVVVVVEDLGVPLRIVVVVVDDFVVDLVVEPFAVVVVVDARGLGGVPREGCAAGFDSLVVARGLGGVPREDSVVGANLLAAVVEVVAFGTLGSSLAPASSRARSTAPAEVPGGVTGGEPGGGGIRSSRRAYCMIREKTGAET